MKKLIGIFLFFIVFYAFAYAAERVIYYCPKCGSEDVKIYSTWKPPEPTIVRRSIDDLPESSIIYNDLILHYYLWIAECGKCGYKRHYSSISFPGNSLDYHDWQTMKNE